MTKKTETGKSATVLDLSTKVSVATESHIKRTGRKKAVSLHERMPRISIQKIRAQYQFGSGRDAGIPDAHTLRLNELQSIYALLAWVANEQKAAIDTVREITETQFMVDDVKKLKQKDYDEVIKFLVDLRIDELKN